MAKLNFERGFAELNMKHGVNGKDPIKKRDPIGMEDYKRKFEDLQLQRDQEEIEFAQENIFEGRKFDPVEFNKFFEKKKKKDERKRASNNDAIAKYGNDIAAFNDFDEASGGIGVDNYNDLYTDDKFTGYNDNYAGLESGMVGNNNGKSDDEISLDSPVDNTYDTHNKGVSKEQFDKEMKKMMAEREQDDLQFDKLEQKDYGSALDDKYGISHQMGFIVGNTTVGGVAGHQKAYKKRDIKEETLKAYKQLTEK
jgi:hypothetical protein